MSGGTVFASNSIIESDCGKDVFYILVICFPDCSSMCLMIEIRANPFFLFFSLLLFSLHPLLGVALLFTFVNECC